MQIILEETKRQRRMMGTNNQIDERRESIGGNRRGYNDREESDPDWGRKDWRRQEWGSMVSC